MTNLEFKKYIEDGLIMPYEQELIDKLRDLNIKGVPLSVIVLWFDACNRNCYSISVYLTSGMENFKLVHGDVNIYPKTHYPNHSWVEKDGYVYDPTDGFKYEKNLYYKLYDVEVIESYDEETCKNYKFYQDIIKKYNNADISFLSILLQHIEEQDDIETNMNHYFLLEEIKKVREKYNIIKRYDKKIMEQYRTMLKK